MTDAEVAQAAAVSAAASAETAAAAESNAVSSAVTADGHRQAAAAAESTAVIAAAEAETHRQAAEAAEAAAVGAAATTDAQVGTSLASRGLPASGAELSTSYGGAWRTATAYVVGDLFVDPSGDLRQVTADHTSGSTYSTANSSPNIDPIAITTRDATSGKMTLVPASEVIARSLGHLVVTDKVFGAKGDGSVGTDGRGDTVALNLACNRTTRIGQRNVYVPPGTYMVDGVNESVSTHTSRYRGGGVVPAANTKLILAAGATIQVITNDSPSYAGISLSQGQDNVTIAGKGKVLGDRATHDYTTDTSSTTHEFGYGISARAVDGLTIEGIESSFHTGDGMIAEPVGLDATLPDYVPCTNLVIRRCKFDSNRRNNISLTGAARYTIEYNHLLNAGINDGVHAGTAPRTGIDLEFSTHQAVVHGTVKGNVFVNNAGGAINAFNAEDVVIEGNFADTPIVLGNNPFRVKARGNILYSATPFAQPGIASSVGVTAADVEIEGNFISGFASGIKATSATTKIRGNFVSNFTTEGILCYGADRPEVTENTIVGDKTSTTQIGIRLVNCTDPKVKVNTVNGAYTAVQTGTLAGAGTQFISGNTFLDCFNGVHVNVANVAAVTRNEFRPGGHSAGDVTQTVAITGSPTGGTFKLQSGSHSVDLAYNAAAATAQTAIQGWGGIYAAVTVSGSAGGPYTITFPSLPTAPFTVDQSALTGGTAATSQAKVARAVGNDVLWTAAADMLATGNDHFGSGVAYAGINTGASKSRVTRNNLHDVTTATAMVFSGAGGKHVVLDNTIIGKRVSGAAGEAITIDGADGSIVLGNKAWSEGAVAFTRLVKSSTSTTTTIKGNYFDGATVATAHASDYVGPNYRIGAAEPGLPAGSMIAAYKTADTTRTNTGTRTADPHLAVAVEANSVYVLEGWIEYEATTTADVSLLWTIPSGATLPWSTGGLASNATSSASATARARIASGGTGSLGGVGVGTAVEARIAGLVTVGSTAGTVTLTWAQSLAEVSDAILYAGSWIKLTKLA